MLDSPNVVLLPTLLKTRWTLFAVLMLCTPFTPPKFCLIKCSQEDVFLQSLWQAVVLAHIQLLAVSLTVAQKHLLTFWPKDSTMNSRARSTVSPGKSAQFKLTWIPQKLVAWQPSQLIRPSKVFCETLARNSCHTDALLMQRLSGN